MNAVHKRYADLMEQALKNGRTDRYEELERMQASALAGRPAAPRRSSRLAPR